MQLTRFDRWLLQEFVHETHIYTLSPPVTLPHGIREVPLPDTPGRRYQHHFIATKSEAADALVAILREHGQMFNTQIMDRDAWYVKIIAPRGKSITWRAIWILCICFGSLAATVYLRRFWDDPEFRQNIIESIKLLKG